MSKTKITPKIEELFDRAHDAADKYMHRTLSGDKEAIEAARQELVSVMQEIADKNLTDEYNTYRFKYSLYDRAMEAIHDRLNFENKRKKATEYLRVQEIETACMTLIAALGWEDDFNNLM